EGLLAEGRERGDRERGDRVGGGSMEDERDIARPWACFDRRFLGVSLGAAAAIVVLALLMKRSAAGSGARLGWGVALAALIAGFVIYTVAAVRNLDELGQRIQLQ